MARHAMTAFGAALMTAVLAAPAGAAELDPGVGRRLAEQHCTACHSIGTAPAVDSTPSFGELARDPATTAASLRFLLTNPHRDMPDLRLTSDEIAALSAYVLSLRPKPR